MSIWTKATGVVRLSGWDELDTDKLFGKELHWEDDLAKWDEFDKDPAAFLPCGSEGSLHLSVYENPNRSDMERYVVTIFGNLRDYSNAKEIVEWFKDKVKGIADGDLFWVEEAMIAAEVDWGERYEWSLKRDEEGRILWL